MSTIKLVADLHVHTLASGHAYSTVAEIIAAAAERGLEAVALTDHGPAMPGGPHRYHFGNLSALPKKDKNVEILRGVEANIIDLDGTIDLPENYLKYLDIVWAGLHFPCLPPATRSLNTEALINALQNPFVDGIVHPGNPDYPIDELAVVQEAIKQGKLLEINNSSFVIRRGSKTRCFEIAKLIHRFDALVALNSDAHIAKYVGTNERAVQLAIDSGIDPQQIINTDLQQLKRFLKKRGKRRFLSYE